MNAHIPPLPALLPSRRAVLDQGLSAVRHGGSLIITGSPGIGRTTLAQMVLAERSSEGRYVHRIAGSQALTSVPFGALATLASQVPGVTPADLSPTAAISALAHKGVSAPRTLFVENAEHIDEESAAAITQLWPTVELIIATTKITDLPPDFGELAFQRETFHAELQPIDGEDARVLLEDLFTEPCNASTVNRLFNLSGGNPLYLRELALQAEQHATLKLFNGYLTLDHSWNPSSGRLTDLIGMRLRVQSSPVRDAVNLIALTGPIPRPVALQIIADDVLERAAHEGLLTISNRHHLTNIAQSFDGPGAEHSLEHPQEMVQLGAGLSFDLVLATIEPSALSRYGAFIHEQLDEDSLPAGARMHLRVAFGGAAQIDTHETSPVAHKSHELHALATHITDLLHRGRPLDGVQVFAENIDTPVWHSAPSRDQTAFIQAMYLAMIGEGSRPDVFDEHFTTVDWHDVSLDHGVFLAGRGDLYLEFGNAEEAEELLAQALGVFATHDHAAMTGFTSGLSAVAATLTGDLASARSHFRSYREASESSGGMARPEVERLTLLVILALEGHEQAVLAHATLLDAAETRGHTFLAMRLLHDAWRLRLERDEDHLTMLDRMGEVASQVQGSFAELLTQYAPAFRALSEGQPANAVDVTVESIAMRHLESGRALFAAEVAARAAGIAAATGDRRRAATLLTMFAQASPFIQQVNTPSLGRARVDPSVLTEREVEVCLAAVEGKSNPEIAAELFLSPRTVEGHLQRAYAKLGITDRRQLLPARPASPRER